MDFLGALDLLEADIRLREDWRRVSAVWLRQLSADLEAARKPQRSVASRKLRTWETLNTCVENGDRKRLGILQRVWAQLIS
eukprot:2072210-Lingulodinium_polyedra.AAC.1